MTSGPTPIAVGGYITYVYDGPFWMMVAHEQGPWILLPFNAADWTASGAMVWTVLAGNVTDQSYRLSGNTIIYSVNVSSTTVGGTADIELRIALPYTCQNTTSTPMQVLSPGTPTTLSAGGPVAGQRYVRAFANLFGNNWGLGNTAIVRSVWTFPVT